MSIQTINPTTEAILETFEPYNEEQIKTILHQAQQAFLDWRTTTFDQRAKQLHLLANTLRSQKHELARLAVLEMGKTITEAIAEVEKCSWNCDYYADNAATFLANQPVQTNATESYVSFQPLGVILALMPWNFPYWQVFRAAAPALMAGNTIVLKHASNVSRVALKIEEIMLAAGFSRGVFSTILVPGAATEQLITHPIIKAVTLTGSDAAGTEVASTSGRMLKKTVLELGGSDAFIVLEDADLDQAAQVAVTARFQNNGQSCIAAKRFIVVESVASAFEQKFVANAARLKVGDPLQPDTNIGPLARSDLRDTLDRQVQASIQQGAKVLLGGKKRPGKGYFYEPTILINVSPEMPIFTEETFGPTAAIIHARDSRHAIELANTSRFGLSSNLWTRNIQQARELANQIEAGGVFINGMTASDPRLPFGGIKNSGYGRELSSFGIQEFVNIQTIWIGPKIENAPTRTASE